MGGLSKYRVCLPAISAYLLLAAWWISLTSYLDLYVPLHSYRGDVWDKTHRTALSRTGESGVEYVLRRDGTAYTKDVGWRSAAEGLRHFDGWLGGRGWERTEIYTQGDPILPESEFLEFGETYAVYTRPEDRSGFGGNRRGAAGRVVVAVWPVCNGGEPDCCVQGFNVVMATARPSFRKALSDAFED
jgi:hypothetical protein